MRKRAYTIEVVSCSLVVALLGSQFVAWQTQHPVVEMPQQLRTFSAAHLTLSDQPKNEGHSRKEKRRVPTLSSQPSQKAVASRRAISGLAISSVHLDPVAYERLGTEENLVRCLFTLSRLPNKRDPPSAPFLLNLKSGAHPGSLG
jgi:hypothetical protein